MKSLQICCAVVGASALPIAPALAANNPWYGNVRTDRLVVAARNGDSIDREVINLSTAQTGPAGEMTITLKSRGETIGEVVFRLGSPGLHSLPLNFSATAGELDTEFFISVPNRQFAAVSDALARADANVIITDLNGDGATGTGMFGDSEFYRWDYNGTVPNGTLFATQVAGPIDAAANGFGTNGENSPGGDAFVALPTPVSILSGRANFTLSAHDRADGTGLFFIEVPTPGTMTLAALAVPALLRRRRVG